MSGFRQGWLVARRELRERGRSRAFLASLGLMVLAVVGFVVAPSLIETPSTRDVGLTGSFEADLPATIEAHGDVVGTTTRVRRYQSLAAGEEAVRDADIDVLVVDGRRLEWRRQPDEGLQAIVTSAIQLVAVQERAAAAGMDPEELLAVIAPVAVENVELGQVTGRGPDDETAAMVMAMLLFFAITTYGTLVLTGVVEEKASRTVEVLLARMPARNLLAGKVAGIGLLGFGQVALTVVAAIVAGAVVDSFDVPAARTAVLAWAVVWFVLGYALYAVVYGALGSLASRTEDAQSAAGPVMVVLIIGFFAAFATIGSPGTTWAQLLSFIPLWSPLLMPIRVAMGGADWWEPVLACAMTLATTAALVQLGGRVYEAAILRTGPALTLRDAWRGSAPAAPTVEATTSARAVPAAATRPGAERSTTAVLVAVSVALGAAIAVLAADVIAGVAVGAGAFAIATRVLRNRAGGARSAHR